MQKVRVSRRKVLVAAGMSAAASLAPRGAHAQVPKKGGRLTVAATSEPPNLNPAIVASNGVLFIAGKVIEPLAEASYASRDGLAPRLALTWESSNDGLKVAFGLRRGVNWHDGQPFTSADVAFSAMTIWRELQNLGSFVFKDLKRVDTPDDYTAILHFSAPVPIALLRSALPPLTAVVPKHAFADTDPTQNPMNNRPIGTGPFQFAEHRKGDYYRLVRNNSYWSGSLPYLHEIVYRVIPDKFATAAMLESGAIDLAAFSSVPPPDVRRMQGKPGLAISTKGYDAIAYQLIVEFNHRRKELSDLAVRQAIAYAIDRKFVCSSIFAGYARPATGLIPPGAREFYTSDVTTYDFDPAMANQLLDKAGYTRGADGTRFSLKLLAAPYFNETLAFGVYLRQALAKIGIDAQLTNNDEAGHIRAVYTDHTFDLAVGPAIFRGDPAISTTILVQGGIPDGVPFSNQGGYDNPRLDALIGKAATTLDAAARADLYRQFQKMVADDLPLISVADWTATTVARSNVHNVANNPRWAASNWADTWIG